MVVSQCSSHQATVGVDVSLTVPESRLRSSSRTFATTTPRFLLLTCRRSSLPSSVNPTETYPCHPPSAPLAIVGAPSEARPAIGHPWVEGWSVSLAERSDTGGAV